MDRFNSAALTVIVGLLEHQLDFLLTNFLVRFLHGYKRSFWTVQNFEAIQAE